MDMQRYYEARQAEPHRFMAVGQPRDKDGKWSSGYSISGGTPAQHQEIKQTLDKLPPATTQGLKVTVSSGTIMRGEGGMGGTVSADYTVANQTIRIHPRTLGQKNITENAITHEVGHHVDSAVLGKGKPGKWDGFKSAVSDLEAFSRFDNPHETFADGFSFLAGAYGAGRRPPVSASTARLFKGLGFDTGA